MMQTSPFPTLPPKGESPECYKLTGRENYKLTKSKLLKENTFSEQQQGGSGGVGGGQEWRRWQGEKKNHTHGH